ncbi:MAG: hypothetical protein DRP58_03260 [Spirochaetes bacterium]|nr:MAG: hypothetical protein DRP58_03260 [Spirochaetota bacterium]
MITTGTLNNKPSRAQIEMVLIENGFTEPLANEVSFSMIDINEKMFNVTYYPSIDRYGYEKLTVK